MLLAWESAVSLQSNSFICSSSLLSFDLGGKVSMSEIQENGRPVQTLVSGICGGQNI